MARPPEFDYYTVHRVLGEGGMGIVFAASDQRTDLPVAIKVMSKRLHDPELQHRFMKENQILASLNHRNIVRCYEITRARDGTPSLVMEYLDGVDFRAFEGSPYTEMLPLMIQAALGLKYLKERNIIHRDLSSNNILVTLENQKRLVKILDFGVAKVLHDKPTDGDVHTQTGQFLGKFAFASPELFSSLDIDWRSDVFSLGVIFHRVLTKEAPIQVERGTYFEWIQAHQQGQFHLVEAPPPLPPLPQALRELVRAMLEKSPKNRPASYDEIISTLDSVQRDTTPSGAEIDTQVTMTLPNPVRDPSGPGSGSKGKPSRGGYVSPHPASAPGANFGDLGAYLAGELGSTPLPVPPVGEAPPTVNESSEAIDCTVMESPEPVIAARRTPVAAPPPGTSRPAPPPAPEPPAPRATTPSPSKRPPTGPTPTPSRKIGGRVAPVAESRLVGYGSGISSSMSTSASRQRPPLPPPPPEPEKGPSVMSLVLIVLAVLLAFAILFFGVWFVLFQPHAGGSKTFLAPSKPTTGLVTHPT